jgi:hypothetical protein
MKDEMRPCVCGKSHPWGILRRDQQGVPTYGARAIEGCDNYHPPVDLIPANLDTKELWAQTGDLDPQAMLWTRAVVARIRQLANGKNSYAAMAAQWPDFMALVLSQITDMRGALVRDESKFAHLVAHTDEVVEAMRTVSQLSERLNIMNQHMREVLERLDYMDKQHDADCADEAEGLAHFGLLPLDDGEAVGKVIRPSEMIWSKPRNIGDGGYDVDDDDD